MNEALGWLLGLKNVKSIDEIAPSLAAPWAAQGTFWVVFGLAALLVVALVFYVKFQHRGSRAARLALGLSRGLLLALLLLTLADPVLRVSLTDVKPPLLYLVFDGTDSMAIEDEYPEDQQAALVRATLWQAPEDMANHKPSRMNYLQAFLTKPQNNLLTRLADDRRFRVESFLFDGNTTSQLRKLEPKPGGGDAPDAKHIAGQLTTKGQVTALGAVLNDMAQQFGAGNLGAVVMFSDFAQNSGLAPIGGRDGAAGSPAAKLGVPIYAVGAGSDRSDGPGGRSANRPENEACRTDQRAGQTAPKRFAGSPRDRHVDGPQVERRLRRYRGDRGVDRPEGGAVDDELGDDRLSLHTRRRRTV
jgi:hypothetical protein